MRPISICFLILGMVACSRMAYADSIRTLDIGPVLSITPSNSIDPDPEKITFECCNGAKGPVNDLEVVFKMPFKGGGMQPIPGCTVDMTAVGLTVQCDHTIPVGQKIQLMPKPADATIIRSKTWWTDDGKNITHASPVPEPSNLILLGSGLLGLVPVMRSKLRL